MSVQITSWAMEAETPSMASKLLLILLADTGAGGWHIQRLASRACGNEDEIRTAYKELSDAGLLEELDRRLEMERD